MEHATEFILQVVIVLTIGLLSIRINVLEHNIEALKEWIKVLYGIDLDLITEAVRKDSDS